MNYGFDPQPFDDELETALTAFCAALPKDNLGRNPYVERDQTYPGVRIRRLTHYEDSFIEEIRLQANAIFEHVQKSWEAAQLEVSDSVGISEREELEAESRADIELRREMEFTEDDGA